jgi:hypothetical protein
MMAPLLVPRPVDLDRVEPFRWAWHQRLLLGYLNLLVGDEGVGKGTFVARLLGRLTTGRLPGDLARTPVRVLVVGDEDGFDNVIVPRLIAADADTSMVFDLPTADNGTLDIAKDAHRLHDLLVAYDIKVVVLDQLLDNLPPGVDPWKDKPVRDAMAPLQRLAATLDLCVIASLHTNKSGAESFRRRVSGTQAFNALSRSSLLLVEHPDDPNRRVLVRGKGNYSAPPPALEFAIETAAVELNGHLHEPTRITEPVDSLLGLEEVLHPGSDGPQTKAALARDLIAEALDDGEWHDAAPIRAELAEAGISASGIKRAANDVGVERRSAGGFPKRNEWRLARGGGLSEPSGPSGPSSGFTGSTRSSAISEPICGEAA